MALAVNASSSTSLSNEVRVFMGEMTADGRQVKNTDRAVPARCHFLRSGSRTAFLCVDGHNESSMVDFDEINL